MCRIYEEKLSLIRKGISLLEFKKELDKQPKQKLVKVTILSVFI